MKINEIISEYVSQVSSIKQPAVLDALYAIGCMNLRSHTEKQFADNIQKLHEQFVNK